MSSPLLPVRADEALALIRAGHALSGLRVEGVVRFPSGSWALPDNLEAEALDFSACPQLVALPRGLRCYELNLSGTSVRELPDDLHVEFRLNLSNCEMLEQLPTGLTVGSLVLRGCRSLADLPEGLDVWFLDLTGCWNFQRWPTRATIRSGHLNLRGCTALHSLPAYLGPLASLNVRECPNLRELPGNLRITGWADLAQSGLTEKNEAPDALRGVDLRWQGVRLDERIIFHPESITTDEVLAERNAERRRVMLDRFGVSRFMAAVNARVLDQDTDPGGERQLLFVEMEPDEALVTLSCFCPSTGRQYFLRVPPATTTCHQAAAWIAGFDNPADYHPLQET